MNQTNLCNWNGTPIGDLPTIKIKNILQNNFYYDDSKNYAKFKNISLNLQKNYFGSEGFEMKKQLEHELFKRRQNHNLKKKIAFVQKTERIIDTFISKIVSATV